jgi:nitroreductase
LIKTRRSVRKWKKEPLADKDITEILEAGMNAPSAGDQRPWEFLVLKEKEHEIYRSLNPNCPPGAAAGIMVCVNPKREKIEGYSEQDCSAAIENILLAIHAKGLGGVWTALFPANLPRVMEKFSIPPEIVPVGYVAFGIPLDKAGKPDPRYDESRLHFGVW